MMPQSVSAEGIVLKSSAPISDKRLSWATMGYYFCKAAIFVGLVLIKLLGYESDTMRLLAAIIAFVGIIGILIVANLDKDSVNKQLDELREMKFKFVHDVTADEVYNGLYPALTAIWGDQVTFDRRDEIISVTHDKIIYDISLNDDGTFIVYWNTSLSNTIFSKDWAHADICRKIRTDTAVIAYELQRQFNITE